MQRFAWHPAPQRLWPEANHFCLRQQQETRGFLMRTSLPVQKLRVSSNRTRRRSSSAAAQARAAATRRCTAASQSFAEIRDVHTVSQHLCLALPKPTQLKTVQISASRKAWPYSSLQDTSTPPSSEQRGHSEVVRTTSCHTKEVT